MSYPIVRHFIELGYSAEKAADVAKWATEGVTCDGCGGPVDGADGATDDVIVLCGSFYGNGCADEPGAFSK
jgi:hypothetical protein